MAKLKLPDSALSGLPGLQPTATVPERLEAFEVIGLKPSAVAQAANVSEATIRNWSERSTSPRDPAARALDDLRTAIVALEEASITGARAATWLTSRNTGPWLRGQRPVEVLGEDPLRVLAAIEDLIASGGVSKDGAATVHLEIVKPADEKTASASPPDDRRKTARGRPKRRAAR